MCKVNQHVASVKERAFCKQVVHIVVNVRSVMGKARSLYWLLIDGGIVTIAIGIFDLNIV